MGVLGAESLQPETGSIKTGSELYLRGYSVRFAFGKHVYSKNISFLLAGNIVKLADLEEDLRSQTTEEDTDFR